MSRRTWKSRPYYSWNWIWVVESMHTLSNAFNWEWCLCAHSRIEPQMAWDDVLYALLNDSSQSFLVFNSSCCSLGPLQDELRNSTWKQASRPWRRTKEEEDERLESLAGGGKISITSVWCSPTLASCTTRLVMEKTPAQASLTTKRMTHFSLSSEIIYVGLTMG